MSNRKPGLKKSFALLLGALFSASVCATPNNSTAAGAIAFEVSQGWVSHFFDEGTQNRWFTFAEMAGHSYCIEAVPGSATAVQLDPNLALYTDAFGTTPMTAGLVPVALTNDNAGGDPHFVKGARVCYIAQAPDTSTVVRSIKVNVPVGAGSGDAGFVKVRIVDTTLYAPCFAKYHYPVVLPAAHLVNLTGASVSFSHRIVAPDVVTTVVNGTIAANAAAGVGFSTQTTPVAGAHGRCLLSHNGPPGSLRAVIITNDIYGTDVRYEMTTR